MSALARAAPVGGRAALLVNVGTPASPSVRDVRRYLAEFLNDPRVIDIPTPLRWMLLNLIILPFRPSKSAHAYQQIWTPEGSPLLINSKKQVEALSVALPGQHVVLAMSYGKPSLEDALTSLLARGVTRITLVPMYPHYASATTGGTVEAWHKLLGAQVQPPASAVLPAFYDSPGFISALAANIQQTVATARPDHVLFSYHGLPIRQLAPYCSDAAAGKACGPLGPNHLHCYRAQCLATTELLLTATGLTATTSTAFQSRIKGTTWLSPFTDEVVVELAKKGVKRLVVACPAFVADCLETLEEIDQEARAAFLQAGGAEFHHLPCLNDQHEWIAALAALAIRHMQGWPTTVQADPATLEAQRLRALARGATA